MKYTPTSKTVEKEGVKDGRPWKKYAYEGVDENGKVEKISMFTELELNKKVELEQTTKEKDGKTYTNWNIAKPDPFAELSKAVMNINVEMGKIRARLDALEKPKATPAQMSEPPIDYDEVNAELAGQEVDESSLPF